MLLYIFIMSVFNVSVLVQVKWLCNLWIMGSNVYFSKSMAAEQVPTEECFTFALEYMDRTVLLKTNKPFDFNMLQLCNVASMVLKRPESPRKHVFRPRVHIPWAFNLDVPVISDNLLHKIVQGCIRRGLRNLDIGVYFTNADATQFQPPMITGMQPNALTVATTKSAPNQPSNYRKRENPSISSSDEGPSKRFAQVQNVPEDVSPNAVHERVRELHKLMFLRTSLDNISNVWCSESSVHSRSLLVADVEAELITYCFVLVNVRIVTKIISDCLLKEEMETTAQQLCEDSDVATKIIPTSQ